MVNLLSRDRAALFHAPYAQRVMTKPTRSQGSPPGSAGSWGGIVSHLRLSYVSDCSGTQGHLGTLISYISLAFAHSRVYAGSSAILSILSSFTI
jgi:hypothetical protein